jgi:hypothetical protein
VGVIGAGATDVALFEALLSSHELGSKGVRIVTLKQVDEIPSAVLNNRIDALFVAGPRGGQLMMQSFQAFRGAIKAGPVFVPISGAPGFPPPPNARGNLLAAKASLHISETHEEKCTGLPAWAFAPTPSLVDERRLGHGTRGCV